MRHERIGLSEVVRFKAPPGFMAALTRAACQEYSTASDFVRRCLVEKLRERGVSLSQGVAGEGANDGQ